MGSSNPDQDVVCVCGGAEVADNSLTKWRLRDLSLRETGIEQECLGWGWYPHPWGPPADGSRKAGPGTFGRGCGSGISNGQRQRPCPLGNAVKRGP